jgi:hypothetical protein
MGSTKSEARSITVSHKNMVKINEVKRMLEELTGISYSYSQVIEFLFVQYDKFKKHSGK